jgi:predicted enzyme related to lactoylglutathione lyase
MTRRRRKTSMRRSSATPSTRCPAPPAATGPSARAATPWAPKGWLTCFGVANADEAVATAEANGGKVVMAPMPTPWGRFAVLEDPWGAPFEVMDSATE